MTSDMIKFGDGVEKAPDADLMREMSDCAIERLMQLEDTDIDPSRASRPCGRLADVAMFLDRGAQKLRSLRRGHHAWATLGIVFVTNDPTAGGYARGRCGVAGGAAASAHA